MPRLIAALFTLAWLAAPAVAQDSGTDDKALARDAAKILKQLGDGQREAVIERLRKLTPAKQRAVLQELIRRHGDKLTEPSIAEELKKLWKGISPEQRQKMLEDAMRTLSTLPPAERAEVLKQYAEFQKALSGGSKKPAKPAAKGPVKPALPTPIIRPQAEAGGPLRQVLRALDKALDKHGKVIDENLQRVGAVMEQAREYLELYRSMPQDQRDEVLRELEDGLKVFLEENVLPELETRFKGLKQAREALQQSSSLIKEYLEAFRGLPQEEREQLMRDLMDAGKLFFEESIKPELERQMDLLRKRAEKRLSKMMNDLLGGRQRRDQQNR